MDLLLSIVIPLYNKQERVLETLDSVLTQEYDDFEVIIVDDGSTDSSAQIVEQVRDSRIRLFRKDNGGPSSARNYGVRKSIGKWILFLDADDTLEKGSLKQVTADIKKHKFADVFCYSEYVSYGNERMLLPINPVSGYVIFPFLRWYTKQIYPGPGRMVVKRKCMEREPFREDYKRWEDGECIFRLMRRYRFYSVPIPLFTYCGDSLDASHPVKDLSKDFCCNLQPKGKSLFEKLAQYSLYQEACWLYPESVEEIYGDAFKDPSILRTIRLIARLEKLKRKIKKFFCVSTDC